MTEFIVVDTPSAYNAILGRPFLSGIRGVLSIYHNVLKFPVRTKVGEVRGDQQAACTCYAMSTNPAALAKQCAYVTNESDHRIPELDHYILEEGEVPDMIIEEIEEEERRWIGGHPTEQLEEIQIRKGDPTKVVKIGGALDREVRGNLVRLLEEYNDIFAWSHDEMPGIPLNLAAHRLAVNATFKSVKQKWRHFNVERNAVVQEEVDKLLKARFIRESRYPEWIGNVVMVTKANGKWRMCVDYTDLNRACTKDSFPLPKIDQLIDSTVGNKLLSFMDVFSGYNQIMMHPADQDRTSFITGQGLYYYKVMPFGLKNAGATYQRLVNKLFKQ
ncbi:hypothetical protein LWI29_018844 [Acer saccharum]|uniref:Reverse transcriptase domain-containing protein n=1 Tax=Acer saccharum TaxID=4024 RepID=A0AA39RXC3_ACESA|nr:hypothetical protein LWI29_018844 [Acer saccharum]